MEYKKLLTGGKIPVIGLGTWLIGGGTEADYSKDKDAIAGINKALELGYTLIDTAEMYGAGHCEELIGKAIKEFDRKNLFIVTKVHKNNLKYDDIISSCKNSLKRMGTTYADLYLIHAPNPEIPLQETMKAMDYLVKEKLTKMIGVSNFSLPLLKEAQKYSKNKIVVNQIEYSLLIRNKGRYGESKNMEKEIIPYCQKNGIIVMAEKPLERGLVFENKTVIKLAQKYGKTSAQIAINWLINKKNIVTMPKAINEEHLRENLGAMGWKLSEKDTKLLDSLKDIDNVPRI